ncbi:hypothetical protein NO357_09230 [Marimonas arenosa]|uniref:Uncharacterized protein n=1 Tax=Marimonas arenosa TaxID=1795305 RepID=A0AAE4B3H8_9RHOB|nr:hypothetical protein [Marimonas arenosa]
MTTEKIAMHRGLLVTEWAHTGTKPFPPQTQRISFPARFDQVDFNHVGRFVGLARPRLHIKILVVIGLVEFGGGS